MINTQIIINSYTVRATYILMIKLFHQLDFSQDALGVRGLVEGAGDLLDGHVAIRGLILGGATVCAQYYDKFNINNGFK